MLGVLFAAAASVLMPVPKRYPGLVFGLDNPNISLEIFIDPLCPVCAMIWPNAEGIVQKFPTQLGIKIHFLPLPYHTWSFVITRSILAVKALSVEKAQQFIRNLLNGDQDQFSNSAMIDTSEKEVLADVAGYLTSKLGISAADFLAKYNSGDVSSDARIDFKFSATHAVSGTPVVYVNGVESELSAGQPLDEWVKFINQLL